MELLSNIHIMRLWFVMSLLLLITKVYAVYATPLPVESATYAKRAATNSSEAAKTSNYFLHQPYGPNTYAFGYQIDDAKTGNVQFRDERRFQNGSIEGSYGYVRPDQRVQVTRYKADAHGGYMAHSQNYAPGEQQLDTVWPTKLPQLLQQHHKMPHAGNVSWDARSHLNVSVDEVETEVAEHLKKQLGVDLNNFDVTEDVIQPGVLDIINGKTRLKQQPNGSLAFEKVHHYIPNDLPLVPFELPANEWLRKSTTVAPTEGTPVASKYNKAKTNNAEKAPQVVAIAMPVATTEGTTLPPTPRPLVNSSSTSSGNWYHKIIQANRREFLEHLPNLNKVNAS